MKILHIITGLKNGGAEGVLYRLLKSDTQDEHLVISLTERGKYADFIENIGIKVITLNMPAGKLTLSGVILLLKELRAYQPDALQTWMYHADLVGGCLARLIGMKKIVWGVRNSDLDPLRTRKTTLLVTKACALLSRFVPSDIITCATRAKSVHTDIGYVEKKFHIVPNGYEFDYTVSGTNLKKNLFQRYSLPINTRLFGIVARYHPQKDHVTALQALKIVKESNGGFFCILVGDGLDASNKDILNEIERLGLCQHVALLGAIKNIPEVMSALDLHILPSAYGEAFPNVVAEAMLYRTPCVVTDVGDAAYIVDDTGWVVPPRDPVEMAVSINDAIHELNFDINCWNQRANSCQRIILNEYSLEKMADNFRFVWGSQ